MMRLPRRGLAVLAFAALCLPLPALGQGKPAANPDPAAAALAEWVKVRDAKAPDPAAWLPTRRTAARAVLQAVSQGATPPAGIGELRQLWSDFGEDRTETFTVPTNCGGQQQPMQIIVWNWAREKSTAELQFEWLEAKGCAVPQDVKKSFAAILAIARDNKVSYSNLLAYSLSSNEAAQKQIGARTDAYHSSIPKTAVVRVGESLVQLSGGIGTLRYDELKALVDQRVWDTLGRTYQLPRHRVASLPEAAQREIEGFRGSLEACFANAMERAAGARRAEYAGGYPAFSAAGGDAAPARARALTLALLHDISRGWDVDDCTDTGGVYPITPATSQAVRAAKLTPPALPQDVARFEDCIARLPEVNRGRLRNGIAEEAGSIACATIATASTSAADFGKRMSALAATRDTFGDRRESNQGTRLCSRVWLRYPEPINEQVTKYREAAAARNNALVCREAREARTWLTAARRAADTYCAAGEAPQFFLDDVTRITGAVDKIVAVCR